MRPALIDLPPVLSLRLLADGKLSQRELTITRGQLGWALARTRQLNQGVKTPFVLVGSADNVTYIIWRSPR